VKYTPATSAQRPEVRMTNTEKTSVKQLRVEIQAEHISVQIRKKSTHIFTIQYTRLFFYLLIHKTYHVVVT